MGEGLTLLRERGGLRDVRLREEEGTGDFRLRLSSVLFIDDALASCEDFLLGVLPLLVETIVLLLLSNRIVYLKVPLRLERMFRCDLV